ncbi:NAD(P)-dependent oxidoreductase [Nocardia beijingensis]
MLIGFAGLGRMGHPMATHLVRAGHSVLAYDPVPGLTPQGATAVASAQDLTAASLSISMLPDGPSTLTVVSEVLRGARPGHLHIVMGTIGPDAVRALGELPHLQLIDAPVSGSVSMAETASITTMVGASAEQFERARPVLAAMTAAQFHAGPVGAGSAAKLAVNAVLAGLNQAVAEGLLIAEAGDLDLDVFYDILSGSAAGAPYVGYKRQAYLTPESTAVAAPVSLIRKDLGLALDLAHRHGLGLPGSEAALSVLDKAVDSGLAEADMARVLTALRDRAEKPNHTIASELEQTGVRP